MKFVAGKIWKEVEPINSFYIDEADIVELNQAIFRAKASFEKLRQFPPLKLFKVFSGLRKLMNDVRKLSRKSHCCLSSLFIKTCFQVSRATTKWMILPFWTHWLARICFLFKDVSKSYFFLVRKFSQGETFVWKIINKIRIFPIFSNFSSFIWAYCGHLDTWKPLVSF